MPDPLDIFAADLRRIRRERGLSQERLAQAGLNMTHVAKIERSECEPADVRTVSKLAKTLEVLV
jgi:transcriptional regulator with XRE-family HTH domain